jgi:mono/diheme cytochrome c family protein
MTARLVVSTAIAVVVSVLAFALLTTGGGEGGKGTDRLDDPRAANSGWSDEGRRVFAAMGCGSCHRLAAASSTGMIGPDLNEELAGHDRESLVHSIVRAPGQSLATMPDDYGERMTDTELDVLVSFLLASR